MTTKCVAVILTVRWRCVASFPLPRNTILRSPFDVFFRSQTYEMKLTDKRLRGSAAAIAWHFGRAIRHASAGQTCDPEATAAKYRVAVNIKAMVATK